MASSIIAGVTPIVIGLLAVIACGNDFDALFARGTADADAGADSGVGRAPSTSGQPGEVVPACTQPATTCLPVSGCQDKACNNTCSGCGCPCTFGCGGGGTDSCVTRCTEGTTCSVTCEANGDCSLDSNGATSARMTCKGNEDSTCTANCQKGGSCEVDCPSEGPCSVTCGAGTKCLVRSGRTRSLDCGAGVMRECGDNVLVCNRDCPP